MECSVRSTQRAVEGMRMVAEQIQVQGYTRTARAWGQMADIQVQGAPGRSMGGNNTVLSVDIRPSGTRAGPMEAGEMDVAW